MASRELTGPASKPFTPIIKQGRKIHFAASTQADEDQIKVNVGQQYSPPSSEEGKNQCSSTKLLYF
jgi:hypothetical protein